MYCYFTCQKALISVSCPIAGYLKLIRLSQVARAIEDLVEEHQTVPGNILRALTERIVDLPKKRPEKPVATNGKCQNGAVKDTSDISPSGVDRVKVS